jgi:head-tail adaptor
MALREPGAGELRARVRFERRAAAGDGYGNSEGPWAPLVATRRGKLEPTRGGEAVIADRLQGTSAWDLWVRFDADTSQVRPDDRAVDARDPARAFNIRFAQDMTGRRRWILMQLEQGVAT